MIARISVPTSMAIAMQNSVLNMHNSPGAFGSHVRQATQRGAGKKSISSWNAHLSHRTALRLKETGILPSHSA